MNEIKEKVNDLKENVVSLKVFVERDDASSATFLAKDLLGDLAEIYAALCAQVIIE